MGELLLSHPGEYAEMVPSILIRHRLDNIAHFTQHHLSAHVLQELFRTEKPIAVTPTSPQEYAEMIPDELIRHHLDNITHFMQQHLSAHIQTPITTAKITATMATTATTTTTTLTPTSTNTIP